MRSLLLTILLVFAPLSAQALDKADDRIAKLLASTDGSTREKAFQVKSVEEEYRIMALLRLKPEIQALIMEKDGHPYDRVTVVDPTTGEKHEIWFDIQSFYGKGFGL